MLSRELEVTLNLAFKTARENRHEFMTVEHLLLALLDDASASRVLKACGADLSLLRHDLQEFIDSTIPRISENDEDQETILESRMPCATRFDFEKLQTEAQ